jgi:hypothetical protein
MRTVGARAGSDGEGVAGDRLRGKWLILRLTARGFWRGVVVAAVRRGAPSGGHRKKGEHLGPGALSTADRSTKHAQGNRETQSVGVGPVLECGLVHQGADSQVSEVVAAYELAHLGFYTASPLEVSRHALTCLRRRDYTTLLT